MPIVLTLHKSRDLSDRQRESRTLEHGTLSIGRGPANNWVLQDPAQHLSKTHCIVSLTANGPMLTDCSSNGVFLNGSKQRMERDSSAPIADGDEFVIGEYLVRVSEVVSLTSRAVAASAASAPRMDVPSIDRDDPFGLDEFLAPPPLPPPAPAYAPPPRSAPRADPFADPNRQMRDDPFGDSFDEALAPSSGRPALPFGEPEAKVSGKGPRDPFDVRDEKQRDAFGDDEDDMFSGKKPAVSWQGPSQPDNVDASAQAFLPPKVVPLPNMDDWDDLLGDEPPGMLPAVAAPAPPPPVAAPQPAAALPVALPPIVSQPVAPPPVAPPPVAPQPVAPQPVAFTPVAPLPGPPAPVMAAAPDGDTAAKLLAAFLDGAGVPKLDLQGQEPEAYFRAAGELFGLMVESLRDVLMSRASVKGEFGVEQTMLRARNNNALKFSVTPEDAVAALLQPGRPGYMQPMAAAKEAFDDVRIHQLAVMAGVQAALFNLLKTFDPAALEARLQKGSVIESFLPGARRAKLWEAFCAAYKDIARDADSDFQAVFGREFARAYSEQARAK